MSPLCVALRKVQTLPAPFEYHGPPFDLFGTHVLFLFGRVPGAFEADPARFEVVTG